MTLLDLLYCSDCGEYMYGEEARCLIREPHPELDGCPMETMAVLRCPYCGSDDLQEAPACEDCGEQFPESELRDGLCPDCYERREKEDAEG